jgi:hypothetical protein
MVADASGQGVTLDRSPSADRLIPSRGASQVNSLEML